MRAVAKEARFGSEGWCRSCQERKVMGAVVGRVMEGRGERPVWTERRAKERMVEEEEGVTPTAR